MKENRKRLRGYRVEYAVGTVLWWRGREIEVVQDFPTTAFYNCGRCVLQGTRTCAYAVECFGQVRKDGTGVHFENVRKEERI